MCGIVINSVGLHEFPARNLSKDPGQPECKDERTPLAGGYVRHLRNQRNYGCRDFLSSGFPGNADECAHAGGYESLPLQSAPPDVLIAHERQPAARADFSQPRFIRRAGEAGVVRRYYIRAGTPHPVYEAAGIDRLVEIKYSSSKPLRDGRVRT
jgi:hypothetical protein